MSAAVNHVIGLLRLVRQRSSGEVARRTSRAVTAPPSLDLVISGVEHTDSPSPPPALVRQEAASRLVFGERGAVPALRRRRHAIAHYGSVGFDQNGHPVFAPRRHSEAAGLDTELLSVLPARRLSARSVGALGDELCAICFDEMRPDDHVACMPCDGLHAYHSHCVQRWLQHKPECPKCRWTAEDEPQPGSGSRLALGVARAEAYLDSLRNSD